MVFKNHFIARKPYPIRNSCYIAELLLFKISQTVEKPINETPVGRVEFYAQGGSKPDSVCLVTFHKTMGNSFFLLITDKTKDRTMDASMA
jgi:hypothetical protein